MIKHLLTPQPTTSTPNVQPVSFHDKSTPLNEWVRTRSLRAATLARVAQPYVAHHISGAGTEPEQHTKAALHHHGQAEQIPRATHFGPARSVTKL